MIDEEHSGNESPIACDMSAIKPALKAGHIATGGQVFRAAEEIREATPSACRPARTRS